MGDAGAFDAWKDVTFRLHADGRWSFPTDDEDVVRAWCDAHSQVLTISLEPAPAAPVYVGDK